MAVATAKANLTKAISAVNKQKDDVETRLDSWTAMSTSLLVEQREQVNRSRDILVAKINRLREYQDNFDRATLAAEELAEPTEEEANSLAEYIEKSTTTLDDATDIQDLLEAEIKRMDRAQTQRATIATSSPIGDTANQGDVERMNDAMQKKLREEIDRSRQIESDQTEHKDMRTQLESELENTRRELDALRTVHRTEDSEVAELRRLLDKERAKRKKAEEEGDYAVAMHEQLLSEIESLRNTCENFRIENNRLQEASKSADQ